MMIFTVLFVAFLMNFAEINCKHLFHDPIHELAIAKHECNKTDPLNSWSCALEKSKLLTPAGDAVNTHEFGPWFTPYAKKCFTYSAKPSNEEADEFVTCFFNTSVDASFDIYNDCGEQFPVDVDLENETSWTDETLAKEPKFGCFVHCMLSKFNVIKDDKLDLDNLNPQLPQSFNYEETAAKCEANHKEDDKCLKVAKFYFCVSKVLDDIAEKEGEPDVDYDDLF